MQTLLGIGWNKMHNQFFISDTHFGHANILSFKRNDGLTPLRPFATIEEHDEFMIEAWNKVVRPVDKVYHLGDAVINRRCLPTLAQLNGKKRLVRGNHDIFKTSEYMQYFDEILGYRAFVKEGFICSHIPIHTESLSRWKANVHGHTHANQVMQPAKLYAERTLVDVCPDPRYVCVSVEHTEYRASCTWTRCYHVLTMTTLQRDEAP